MSSDETGSSLSSSSDEDIMCSPCDLEDMSSSSADVDSSSGKQGQEPKYVFVRVKETSEVRHLHDSYDLEAFKDDLETYFNDLTKIDGKMRIFPKSMERSVAEQHPKILENLKCLAFKDVFVYLGNTFVVTLNMDNKRIRIPSRLICDASVFSSNKAVLVLSFVKRRTDMVRRLDMYNNFVARGVTEALRTFLNDTSVIRGVIGEESNLSACLPVMEKRTIFFHPSSISMDEDKRNAAVKAILRSAAVAQAVNVFPTSANGTWEKGLYFLKLNEFEFLSEFIDMKMKGSFSMNTVQGQKDIIALELASRISRSGKTAIHLHQTGHDEALKAHREKHPNLDVFSTGSDIECGKYKHIFAAKMDHIKGDKKIGGTICIISTSKADSKSLKKLTKNPTKRQSWRSRFFRKTATVHISQESGVERRYQSMPNLSAETTEVEVYPNQKGIILVGKKPLTEPVGKYNTFTTITTATQLTLQPSSSVASAESEDPERKSEVQIKRKKSTTSESDSAYSLTSEISYGERPRGPVTFFGIKWLS